MNMKVDTSEKQTPGYKFADYELKGVPVRLAMGGRDLENGTIEIARRDTQTKETVSLENIEQTIQNTLEREISTDKLGEMVMERLKPVDEVAYIRFDRNATMRRVFEEDGAEEIYRQELRERLDAAMNEEVKPEEEKILRLYYYEGKSDPEIAGLAGCTGSTIQAKRKDALMKLYRAQRRYRLEEFIEDHTNYYMAAGVGAFQNSGGSVVENLVIRREDLKYKFLKGET